MKSKPRFSITKSAASLLTLLIFIGLAGCSNDDDGNAGTANLAVRMTDAPGDYEAVFVDVQDVRIKSSAEDNEEEGWESVGDVNAGVYNLMELTGGIDVLLADTQVPAGHLSQIRLILGEDNSIVVNGETMALNTPSAQQSGLKLQVNQELEAGSDYYFLLDFDVDQSIVSTGSGGYNLHPVIRLVTGTEGGKIEGTIEPAGIQTLVQATNGTSTISSYANAEGEFVLHGVPDGTYVVTITPDLTSGFGVVTVENVEVNAGSTITLDPITLE